MIPLDTPSSGFGGSKSFVGVLFGFEEVIRNVPLGVKRVFGCDGRHCVVGSARARSFAQDAFRSEEIRFSVTTEDGQII